MVKRLGLFLLLCILPMAMSGCVGGQAGSAAGDLLTAAAVSDADLIRISQEMRAVGDKENTVATSKDKYGSRLARLTNRFTNEDGLSLNFKAYITKDINANATADGSIRVSSGLMDLMTDNELLFVVGHEIGHVKRGHSLSKVRMAYASSGAIKAAGAAGGQIGTALSSSQLGDLLHQVLNAQFSQSAELESDAYGYQLMKKYKIDTKAAVSALQKLDKLGAGGGVMSSHPASAERASKIAAMIKRDK